MSTLDINLSREGRRTYIVGDTFRIKDDIKAAGGHWDADRRAWWLGDHAKAESLVAGVKAAPPAPVATYARIGDGWGIRGKGLVVGASVTVEKRDGAKKTEKVTAVVSTDADGTVLANIEPSAKPASRPAYSGGYRGNYGGGRRRACKTGGNCSSFGSGKSCGGYDCDGY